MTLPTSPNEMPNELWNDTNWLRNTIMQLDSFTCVDIHWEKDRHQSNALGESVGEWTVVIETRSRESRGKHKTLLNALWYAFTLADARYDEAIRQHEVARINALAKLTPEDRKILGV